MELGGASLEVIVEVAAAAILEDIVVAIALVGVTDLGQGLQQEAQDVHLLHPRFLDEVLARVAAHLVLSRLAVLSSSHIFFIIQNS